MRDGRVAEYLSNKKKIRACLQTINLIDTLFLFYYLGVMHLAERPLATKELELIIKERSLRRFQVLNVNHGKALEHNSKSWFSDHTGPYIKCIHLEFSITLNWLLKIFHWSLIIQPSTMWNEGTSQTNDSSPALRALSLRFGQAMRCLPGGFYLSIHSRSRMHPVHCTLYDLVLELGLHFPRQWTKSWFPFISLLIHSYSSLPYKQSNLWLLTMKSQVAATGLKKP